MAVVVHSSDDPKLAERRRALAEDRIAAFSKGLPKVSLREGIQTIASGDVNDARKAHRAETESDLTRLLREAGEAEAEALRLGYTE